MHISSMRRSLLFICYYRAYVHETRLELFVRTESMADTPYNFLLIMTDQQRADHLSCAGNTVLATPNLDRIAASGVRFERFYVANPVCMPNRATLMTGRLPSNHGVRHNGIPLHPRSNTVVHLLRHAGYRTAMVGTMPSLPDAPCTSHRPGVRASLRSCTPPPISPSKPCNTWSVTRSQAHKPLSCSCARSQIRIIPSYHRGAISTATSPMISHCQ